MGSERDIEKLKTQFEHFCEWVRADTIRISEFFDALKVAVEEDKTIKEEITQTQKYKNFILGIKQLSNMIDRIIENLEVAKSMSHIYVFDFDTFQEQLKEYQATINSHINIEKPTIEPLETACNECFHWVEKEVEYEEKKYHATCINYRLVKMKLT